MNSELEKLIKLQKTDTKIHHLKKAIETADERRAIIEQEFEQHASTIREIQNKRDKARSERSEFEAQIAEKQTYLERANRNLKTAQDQKQYETSMRETDALQKQITALETQALEKMTEIEETEKILDERAEEINSLEGKRSEAVSVFEGELKKNKSDIAVQIKKRDEVMTTIPPNWASVYNRLVNRSQDGIAVAEVKNGACTACFISLRPHVLQKLRKSDEIITCENCTRILYIPTDDAKAANQES